MSNNDRRHLDKVCKTACRECQAARYANKRTLQVPRDSKFRFYVPVDVEWLRYCSKIFVMLMNYGNVVLNIVSLAVWYHTACCQKAVISTAKLFFLRILNGNFGLSIVS